jgi:hypothetical protein
VDDTIDDLNVSVGDVKDRIVDTQSSGNMSMTPPIEFDITILKTTNKDICKTSQIKLRIKSNVLVSDFLHLILSLMVSFLDDVFMIYIHESSSLYSFWSKFPTTCIYSIKKKRVQLRRVD